MTVNVLYTVWCDGKREDDSGDCGEWITADTAWEARDEARAAGWKCGKKLNSRDLCPKHAPPSSPRGHNPHEHEFTYDDDGRMRCTCGTYLFEHAPDHPYGSQPGPNGRSARWCLRDDCDWRETT